LPVKSLVLAVMLSWSAMLQAADLSQPHILVAKPELRGPLFATSIIVVKPLGGGEHIGFIVNRPTDVTLGKVFPEHGPSRKVVDPVYLGGPIEAQVIFALVQRPDSPGGHALEVLPGLFAAADGPVVDRIIESEADHARFVAGLVVWQPGELAAEIEQGAWFVLEPDAQTAMRKPEGLWEELVRRSAARRDAI
jgi:putative transcriptional regulator